MESGDYSLNGASSSNDLEELKKDLEGWREALIPLNKVLHWEKNYHPAIIAGIVTFIFLLIWYFDPTSLQLVAVLGMAAALIDFAIPLFGPSFLAGEKWTGKEQKQFEEICQRIMHFRDHLYNFKLAMVEVKADKPKLYFIGIMSFMIFLAWIGTVMNNLFLFYVVVLVSVLFPGMRQHPVLKKYLVGASVFCSRLIHGKSKTT